MCGSSGAVERGVDSGSFEQRTFGVGAPRLSACGRRVAQAHIAALGHIKDAVHHYVHRAAKLSQMGNRNPDKGLRVVTCDVGQDNQSRVDCPARDEATEVSGVLCDENEVLIDATIHHTVVRVAQATVIPRVKHDMVAFAIEDEGDSRRDAFVEE